MQEVDFRGPFVVQSRILRAIGLWSEETRGFFGPNLYTVYALAVLAICNLQYFFELAHWFLAPADFETMASSALVLFSKLITDVKAFCVIRHHVMLKRFLHDCNRGVFQPKTRRQREGAEGMLKVYRWIYRTFQVAAILSTSSLSFNTLFGDQEEEAAALPFVAWYPYDYRKHFWPTYLHQTVSSFFMGQTHVTVDCLAIGLLIFVIVQCDMLADGLGSLGVVTGSLLEASGRLSPEERKELMLDTEKQFYACIRHHKDVLSWFREIHDMLSALLFAQYAVSFVTLGMTLTQASLVAPSDPKFASMVMYSAVVLGQLFLYCWWGNEVIAKSSRIPGAAFESGWPEMSPRTKKDLLTFVSCSQRPMELFGAGYFRVSLQNFVLILRHSYSFYAVLHRMNS